MATSEQQAKAKTASRPALTERDEKRLAVIESAFPGRKDAVSYGRKILKVQAGLRATAPPLSTLTKEEGAKVYEILGVAQPERKPREKAEEPEPVVA